MKAVHGDELVDVDRAWLENLLADYAEFWLDIGAGDGGYVYEQARSNPTVLCAGFDPAWRNMSRNSSKAMRRKTIAPNALFLQGSIESPPEELAGLASRISINYPWSGLLRALVCPDAAAISNIRRLARPQALLTIYLNMYVFQEDGIKDSLELPDLNEDYAQTVLKPTYAASGLEMTHFEVCSDRRPLRTSWGSRLSLNSGRPSCLLTFRACQ